ncbi:hypothetical protein BVX98_06930 [bacterium F11]|nr:hypothetical protein BVX98_06930 [bacterium F11]
MDLLLEIGKTAFIILGTLFSLIGVIGMIRLPDAYTRLHATGKVSVFGIIFLLLAAILGDTVSLGKGLVYVLLILIAGPVASHAIALAAYRSDLKMKKAVRDDFRGERERGQVFGIR